MPMVPVGRALFKFPCGRKSGFESAEYVLPRNAVNDKGAILQLEFETEWGTSVQCGDIIIQKDHPFVPTVCNPKC